MFDNEGFLIDLTLWTEEIAKTIAVQEHITLTPAHWELLFAARRYYQQFELSPEMRPFVKWLQTYLHPEKGKSIYLLQLFPGSPAKLISKIAGLPKPANCL